MPGPSFSSYGILNPGLLDRIEETKLSKLDKSWEVLLTS